MSATPTGAVLLSAAGAAGFASLGIEPAPVFWALVGASLGMTFASPTSRLRAVFVFVAVVLACSLFGSYLAGKIDDGAGISRNVCACGLAILFHPILNAVVAAVPSFIARRFGGNP